MIPENIERTAYPRFKRQLTAKELTEIYTPTPSEIAFAYATTKGESNILNLVSLLKSFQRLGYFPALIDIPPRIVNHIRSNLMDDYDISPFPIQTQEELQQEVTQTLQILEKYKR